MLIFDAATRGGVAVLAGMEALRGSGLAALTPSAIPAVSLTDIAVVVDHQVWSDETIPTDPPSSGITRRASPSLPSSTSLRGLSRDKIG